MYGLQQIVDLQTANRDAVSDDVAPTFDCRCPDVVVLVDIVGSHDDDVDIALFISLAPGE
jgi:hypothetical protein